VRQPVLTTGDKLVQALTFGVIAQPEQLLQTPGSLYHTLNI
jgi:hypothetical protein